MRKMWLIALLAALLPMATAAQQGGCGLTVPVHEAFDNYGIGSEAVPTCWYVTRNYDLGYAPHLDGSHHHSGTASLVLYPGTLVESHYSMAIMPELDNLATLDGLHLRFHLLSPSTASRIEVGLCEDTNRVGRAFVALDTLHVDQGNRWQEVVVDLSRYSGTGRRIAFRMQRALQNTNDECYIDDISVETCGTTTPWANHIGSTTVTLNFESFGIGIVEVSYGDTVISPAVSPLTLTGLTPDSEYLFRIGCAGTNGTEVAVRTLEGAGMTVAYYENFDAVDSVMPRHWHRPTVNRPQVTADALRMTPTEGDSCMAVMPLPSNAGVSELTMSFSLAGSGTARLIVGAMEYANEPESFTAIDTVTPDGSRHTVPLTSYSGQGSYIALLAIGNGTLTVDELRVARCLTDSVRIYNLTESGLTLAWDTLALADSASVLVEYGAEGFAPGTGTLVTTDHQPLTLDGLESDRTYDLYLWPSCGDQPSAYDKHSFHTFAHEVTPPYCTGFEEGALPQGWVAVEGATLTDAAYDGAAALLLSANGIVTLPLMGDDTPDSLYLEFYGFGNSRLLIGRMATPYSPFTAMDTVVGDGSWDRYSVHIAGTAGQCLALKGEGAWTIDALALRTASVGNPVISAVEQHSAHVAWTLSNCDSVRVEYAAVSQQNDDFAPGSGTVTIAGSDISITGLASDTRYRLHVIPFDSLDDGSCHYLSVGFITLPAPVELPYCQNFDGVAVSSYPSNWRRLSEYGEYPFVSNDRNRSGGRSMRLSVFGGGATVAVLPDIESCSQHPTIALWANATVQHQNAKLIVGTMTDATDTATFTAIDTLLFASSDNWTHYMTRLDSLDGHLALMLRGGASGETRVYVEDLCIEPCVATNIRVSNIDSASATVSWNSADSLSLVCVTTGGGATRRDTLLHSPADIAGFNNGTTYTLTFTALCGCGGTGATYRPGQGSSGTTSDGGRTSISINTQPSRVTMPYCNGFESTTGSVPSSWRYSGTLVVTDRNYHNGYHSLQSAGGSTIILPPIDNLSTATLSFYFYGTHQSLLGSNALMVGVMNHPDSTATFVPLDTLHLSALGTWQHMVVDLGAYSGTGRFITLLPVAGSGTIFIDDLMVASCCIGEAAVDSNGTLSWRTWHGVSSVAIEYGPMGFQHGNGITDTIDCTGSVNHSTTIPALAEGGIFDIHLTPTCSGANNCQKLSLQIGNVTTTPYCEDFDDVPAAAMPGSWLVSRTYSNTPEMSILGGNQRLHLKAAVGNRSIATLPQLSVNDISTHQISLDLRVANHNRTRLIVGQIGDASDPNTFIPHDTLTLTASNVWQTLRLPLNRFSGNNRIALACDAVTQTAEMWIDGLAVTDGITPQLAVMSARRVRLANRDSNYFVEYGPAGTAQGDGTVLHITDSVADITGLSPLQTYWFYCRHSADEPTCLAPLTATMPDEESLPYCHRRDTITTLVLPELETESVATLHLYFRLRGGSSLAVGVLEQQGEWTSFNPIDTVVVPSGIWRHAHVALDSYTGDGRFVALRTTGGTNAIIDGLTVSACELPTVTLGDDNHVSLGGNGAVEYGPAGFTLGSGTIIASPATLPLADTTDYDFYTLCSTNVSTCASPWQVSTSLALALPLCENFGSGFPTGWTIYSDAASGGTVNVANGRLTMQATAGQTVGVRLPRLPTDTLYFTFDMGGNASLLLGTDILSGAGRKTVAVANGSGRPSMQVVGTGTVTIDNLSIENCRRPDSIAISQPGDGRVVMNWDTTTCDAFFIEYTHSALQQGEGNIVGANTPPLTLTLDPDTIYNIYLRCDSVGTTCRAPQQLATLAALTEIPYCTGFEDDAVGAKPAGWRVIAGSTSSYGHVTVGNAYGGNRKLTVSNASGTTYLIIPQPSVDSLRHLNITLYAHYHNNNGHSLILGAMSDASDPSTFDSLAFFTSLRGDYTRCFFSFKNYYGNGKFIALKVSDNDVLDIDDVQVSTCAAHTFRISEMATEHVVIVWEQQGEPEISITYGPRGFDADSGTVVHPTASPCRIEGLSPLTNYAFIIASHCTYTTGNCSDKIETDTLYTFTPQGGTGCIDYTDLTAPYVTCSHGTYLNPMENNEAVDYGYSSAMSRHTVHYDTAERDGRTQGLLRTIPADERASVRLGNWLSGGNSRPEAESITYGMTVDADAADLLVLRYAAVLQDPEHAPSLQPRFRMEILNQEGSLIDSCSMADFIADDALGWAMAPNDVLWKDWTTVGIDLAPYNGQTIFVRLTTHDCGEGSHFGYAYFTLRCASKLMQVEGCSNVPNNRFTVPSGFNYRWYSSADTTVTVSDSSSIWVRSDNSVTYYCRLSFIDNPACHFTMSAFAGARYPLAIIDTALTVTDCEFDLQLFNNSTISGDGVTPAGTGEPCDTYMWMLPSRDDGNLVAPTLHLTDTGIVSVTLIVGIANDQCIDTLTRDLHITYPHPAATTVGRHMRCYGDNPDTIGVLHAATYHWSNYYTGNIVDAATSDTTFIAYTVDSNGCRDTLAHQLSVMPIYDLHDADSVCSSSHSFDWRDTTVTFATGDSAAAAILHRSSQYGCDSTMTLALHLWPDYYPEIHDSVCDGTTVTFFDTLLAITTDYTHHGTTMHGCDSLTTMHLTVMPVWQVDDRQVVCDSLRWNNGQLYLSDTAGVIDSLHTAFGCDSVVQLLLTVNPSKHYVYDDTACEGQHYLFRGRYIDSEGYHADTLYTTEGCDSVLGVVLTLLEVPPLHIRQSYDCASQRYILRAESGMPYLWWLSEPYDSTLYRQRHNANVFVSPDTATIYRLYADYSPKPRCPQTIEVSLLPYTKPEARLRVSPGILNANNRTFEARDIGKPYAWRQWYIDSVLLDETGYFITGEANSDADTVLVRLVVGDDRCTDTAKAVIPMEWHTIYAPNAFTPGAESNREFYVQGRHIADFEINIYNRRGVLVYSSNDIGSRWDGRNLQGHDCPSGNYIYYIIYTTDFRPTTTKKEVGQVLLIR